jgi:uracil phosphoribosyltransferase
LTRLRDRRTSAGEFRALLASITSFLIYEALVDLEVERCPVETPLATAMGWRRARPLAFIPILRAGLGMALTAQDIIPDATVWHLGLSRDEVTLEPVIYYHRFGPGGLKHTTAVVLDPMLATAGSARAAIGLISAAGAHDIRFVGIVGAPAGVAALNDAYPDVRITLASLDERLTGPGDPWPSGYIVPGLGDAGDRQFGTPPPSPAPSPDQEGNEHVGATSGGGQPHDAQLPGAHTGGVGR